MRGTSFFARMALATRYEQHLLEIVTEAVQLLAGSDAGENEPSLNRKLYQSIISTYHRRHMRGDEAPDFAPAFDAPNPPLTYEFAPSETKRPDLRWDLVDHQAGPESVRSFAVECKRLRSMSSSGWKFNNAYAVHGVARFVAPDHQYGANTASGTMVGYWQNMSRGAILAEVNAALQSIGLPDLVFNNEPSDSLHQTDQTLNRSFEISPYRLRHLWLDMRSAEAVRESEEARIGAGNGAEVGPKRATGVAGAGTEPSSDVSDEGASG